MMIRMYVALVALVLLSSRGATAALDGSWLETATPTTIRQGSNAKALCKCSSDPLLKDPACTLCYCPDSGDLSSAPSFENIPDGPENRTCGASGTKDSVLKIMNSENGEDDTLGVDIVGCRCGPDPWLSSDNAAWTMCKCPRITFCSVASLSDYPCPDSDEAPPSPSTELIIPDRKIYSHVRNDNGTSPPLGAWGWCEGKYALCSMANCTMEYKGKNTSPIGGDLAECGCITATSSNGLGTTNFVDPTYILSLPLYKEFQANCTVSSNSSGCPGPNKSAVCKAIASNTIYKGGNYDLSSTFALSPQLGGFQVTCPGPGSYAQCMTAACYEKPAFDGSPVTCYCPVYTTNSSFVVGGAWNEDIPCSQPYPYLLSGVDSDF